MITDYSKQMELIKPHEFTERINIIGAGALGSWIAFILLKMGFKDIHVYDFDTIEEHNIPNQLYSEYHIGASKVESLDAIYKGWFADQENIRLTVHNEKLTEDSVPLSGVIFSAVDTMSSRKELYNSLFKWNPKAKIWIEGRIAIYGAYVYSIVQGETKQYHAYEKTLYDDIEAEVSACGISQTALPAAINSASIMVMQMIEWFKNPEDISNYIEYSIPWLTNMVGKWKED